MIEKTIEKTIRKIGDTLERAELPKASAEYILENAILKGIEKKPFYLSKKWWATIGAILIPVLNRVFGLEMNTEDIVVILTPVLIYVISQGISDIKK